MRMKLSKRILAIFLSIFMVVTMLPTAVFAAGDLTVTYDGNSSDGGTAPIDSSSPYTTGDTVTVLGNTGTLTKANHTFGGWNTQADGQGTAYAAGATFNITANTTLYAVWTPDAPTPTYGITLDKTGTHTFTAADVGYAAQTPLSVTVTNSGNQGTGALTIALSGTNASDFTLGKASIADIAVGSNDTFTVVPNTGLAEGTYTATVTVSGGNSITATFDVTFTVNAATPAPTYGVTLDKSGTHTFTAAEVGYVAQTPVSVTVTNSGNQATGALIIALSGTNASDFTLGKASIADIAAGSNDTFTVVPNTGLAEGTYTATVTVSGGNSITATFDVTFTVNAATPAPTYGVTLDKSGTHTFTAAEVGYVAQTPVSVTVTNSGNQGTGALSIALSGTNASNFTLDKASIADIAAGSTDTFTVVPNDSLAEGTYTATVTVSGSNSITATFDVSFTVNAATPVTPVLDGTLTITGTAKFGETLTANTSSLTGGSGAFSYSWKRDGTEIGTSSSYVLVEADIGKQISCVVSRADATGTKIASSATVTKADGPAAPSITFSLIDQTNPKRLMGANDTMEYSVDDGATWTMAASNQELTITAACTIKVRVKATNTHLAGAETSITITKAAAPLANTFTATGCTIAGNDGTIDGISALMEYKLSTASTWTDGTGSKIENLAAGTYNVRVKATATALASDATDVVVDAFVAEVIAFNSLTANGASNTTATTLLTLTFAKDISGLADTDITVTGATKGALTSKGSGEYELEISNITVANLQTVTVKVTKAGYEITPAAKTVVVYQAAPAKKVTDVSLNKKVTSLELSGSATEQLTATVAPSDATNKAVTWRSSNPAVATVNNAGLVTAVAVGTATITVTTVEGSYTASCAVTVRASGTAAPTAVTFSSITANDVAGTTTSLTLTFDKDIAGLSANDIMLVGATKGALTRTNTGVYNLAISNITVKNGGYVKVSVAKAGYEITKSEHAIMINKAAATTSLGKIVVKVENSNGETITKPNVVLKKGSTVLREPDESGIITDVPYGTYSIVATFGNKVVTESITVNKTANTEITLTIPADNRVTDVIVATPSTPPTAASGLNNIFTDTNNPALKEALDEGKTVDVKLEAEKKTVATLPVGDEKTKVEAVLNALPAEAKATAAILDLGISVAIDGVAGTPVTELTNPVEIKVELPPELQSAPAQAATVVYKVTRVHTAADGTVTSQELTGVSYDPVTNTLKFNTDKFSIFVVSRVPVANPSYPGYWYGGWYGNGYNYYDLTLSFYTNGGSYINPEKLAYGASIDPYKYIPVKSGYVFGGWYQDAGLTKLVTANTRFNESTTLYVRWLEDTAKPAPSAPNTWISSNPQTGDSWFKNLFE